MPARPRLDNALVRAKAFKASDREMQAFLRGLQVAEATCLDVVEEIYNRADAASGGDRSDLNRAAAGAKACASHIEAVFDAVAEASGQAPTRRGIKALLSRLLPSQPAASSTAAGDPA
ncbi:hypothetical protein [Paracraurococcus ruber]|uniref:HPt domain-containing protein n=1 Tax=Paracraurococcus ruber TaxID=77675 RepID=A0ABS1CR09_9PROT|nr:hypothetical protein [Paracraurococcus ruber]MBK1656858.1 hypothetical protein [Paracraurococcus ruber]TDG33973.1 hypothetical protein E2C05_01655 [Paracraurococcus ruber]